MFENFIKMIKKLSKKETEKTNKEAAKERLHLVLMQDRANVSADFLDLMKQEIIDVIKKYIDVDENEIDVKLTNKQNSDGTVGAPALYANIPIKSIKNETRMIKKANNKESQEEAENKTISEENVENLNKENSENSKNDVKEGNKNTKNGENLIDLPENKYSKNNSCLDSKAIENKKNVTSEADKNANENEDENKSDLFENKDLAKDSILGVNVNKSEKKSEETNKNSSSDSKKANAKASANKAKLTKKRKQKK